MSQTHVPQLIHNTNVALSEEDAAIANVLVQNLNEVNETTKARERRMASAFELMATMERGTHNVISQLTARRNTTSDTMAGELAARVKEADERIAALDRTHQEALETARIAAEQAASERAERLKLIEKGETDIKQEIERFDAMIAIQKEALKGYSVYSAR